MTIPTELINRIYNHCVEVGECLEWRGALAASGGMYVSHAGKKISVRRTLWEHRHGEVPPDRLVSVSCQNPRCVKCLQIITASQRNKRIARRGLFSTAAIKVKISKARSRNSKLSDADVADVRAWQGRVVEIAQIKGISESYAHMLRAGRFRKDYGSPFAGLGARS